MIDILTVLGAIQTSIDCAKGVSEGLKAIKEVDQQLTFLEMRQQQAGLIESLLDAKEKIRELHFQLALQEQMEHQPDGNIFWKIDGEKRSGPYCAACYGSVGKAITLSGSEEGNAWDCPVCEGFFATKSWHQVRRIQIQEGNRSLRRF